MQVLLHVFYTIMAIVLGLLMLGALGTPLQGRRYHYCSAGHKHETPQAAADCSDAQHWRR